MASVEEDCDPFESDLLRYFGMVPQYRVYENDILRAKVCLGRFVADVWNMMDHSYKR